MFSERVNNDFSGNGIHAGEPVRDVVVFTGNVFDSEGETLKENSPSDNDGYSRSIGGYDGPFREGIPCLEDSRITWSAYASCLKVSQFFAAPENLWETKAMAWWMMVPVESVYSWKRTAPTA